MASEFIGYNVVVTLQVGKLQGQVANVIGQTLLLENGIIRDPGPVFAEICTNSLYAQSLSCGVVSTMLNIRLMPPP
jgi:hypothetical protein